MALQRHNHMWQTIGRWSGGSTLAVSLGWLALSTYITTILAEMTQEVSV